jgi:hypothetical protein
VTTAFSGIPAVHGFSGLSNRSGAGTWHLYAIDDIDNSFGISSYFVKLNPGPGGSIPAISNRSPNTVWFDIDGDNFSAGFASLRSVSNANPITGAQGLSDSNTPRIGGFGISASDFQLKVTGAESFAATTNGQWGKYADFGGGTIPGFAHGHNPLFLAEGTYTGSPPTVDLTTPAASGGTSVQYWTDANLTSFASATQLAPYHACSCGITIFDGNITNVNANNPGFVNYTFTVIQDLPSTPNFVPMTWDIISQGYPAQPATIDSATSTFHWNTINAPPGTYTWSVRASAEGYSGAGYLHVTIIPEPTTLALVVTVLPGLINVGRRRHA